MTYISKPLDIDGFKVKFKDEISGDYFGDVQIYSFSFFSNWGN